MMSAPLNILDHRAAKRFLPKLMEFACRAGYAARGAVYVSVGVIAFLAAIDRVPQSKGAIGALEAWAAWPPGLLLLWLIGLGLYGFAGWRLLQSVFDADQQGNEPKAIASRVGQAISGLVYGALAVSVFGLIDTLEDFGEADDSEKTRQTVQEMLAMPGGELLVITVGLFVLGCGVGNIVQAIKRDFCKRLQCDRKIASKAAMLGRIGYGARGLVFLMAGGFSTLAGFQARGSQAKGTAAAMDWLESLPGGGLIMGCTALGLVAFGLFAMVEARYRRLNVREVVADKL